MKNSSIACPYCGHLRWLFLFVFFFFHLSSYSQVYPVSATTQLVPPYSTYLPDYASEGSTRLRVILLQRDLTQASYDLKLKINIELNGKLIMSTSAIYNAPVLTVSPGVPTIITGSELAPYLDSRNIDFIGYSRDQYEKTKSLPEGSYKITFTAWDYHRPDVKVSDDIGSYYYLAKAEPPLLNLPINGSFINTLPYWGEQSNTINAAPGVLNFQWLPRNTSSPNSASNTEYTFELWEIRPEGSNHNFIAQSSKPIYTTTTQQTSLMYTPDCTPLSGNMYGENKGGAYAWRVTAKDLSGRDQFTNNGQSEVYWFKYGGTDPKNPFAENGPVHNPNAIGESWDRGKIWWDKTNPYDNVTVYYRKANSGKQGFDWHTKNTQEDSLKIFDLEENTEYEYRLVGKKGSEEGPATNIQYFKTKNKPVHKCGEQGPQTQTAKGEPELFLLEGTKVKVNDFELTVKKITKNEGNGWYAGEGSIGLTSFGGAVAVYFKKIYINIDHELTRGEVFAKVNKSTASIIHDQQKRADAVQSMQQWKGKIPDPLTSELPTVIEFAKDIVSTPKAVIEGSVAINGPEKEQILQVQAVITEALEILNSKDASAEDKQTAEKTLRNTLEKTQPVLEKFIARVGNGIPAMIGNWFSDIRAFLKGYKGEDEDKIQAKYWHGQTDSIVHSYLDRTDIADSVRFDLNNIIETSKSAWIGLENGIPCGYLSAYTFPLHGPNADILMEDFSCYVDTLCYKADKIEWYRKLFTPVIKPPDSYFYNKNVVVFVNGYRSISLTKIKGVEYKNSDNSIQTEAIDDYWEGIDETFNKWLKDRWVYYADGHHSISTSNHRVMPLFAYSMFTSGDAKGSAGSVLVRTALSLATEQPHWVLGGVTCYHNNSCVHLNTDPNVDGFNQRRTNGETAGRNLVNELDRIKFDKVNEKVDIVAHSMGYAYSLGIIDVLLKKGYKIGRYYILAPENAGAGGMDWSKITEQYWQYGSDENALKNEKWLQDGVAPQTRALNLPERKRAYIPRDWEKQGFLDSHSISNYTWIFEKKEGERGYVLPR